VGTADDDLDAGFVSNVVRDVVDDRDVLGVRRVP
jgi:hypothetical protein